jgi:hypothetical protein
MFCCFHFLGFDFSLCFIFSTPPAFLLGSFHWYLLWLYDGSDASLAQDGQLKGQAENTIQDSDTKVKMKRSMASRLQLT